MSFLLVKQAQTKYFLKINTKTFKIMQSPNIMTHHNECVSVIKEKPTTLFDNLISNFKKRLLKKKNKKEQDTVYAHSYFMSNTSGTHPPHSLTATALAADSVHKFEPKGPICRAFTDSHSLFRPSSPIRCLHIFIHCWLP